MKVIIKGKVENVSDGYAQNYLFPRRLAVPATQENLQRLENNLKQQEQNKKLQDQEDFRIFSEINSKVITINVKTGEGDKLFGSVTKDAIAQSLKTDKKYIQLKEPIKHLGTYTVPIQVGAYSGKVTANVIK